MAAATPWDCALRYLGQRAHSRTEIETKLARRDFQKEDIAKAMERLEAAGLLDDEQFAADFVRSRLGRRSASRQELRYELKKRGIEPEVLRRTLAALPEDSDYEQALQTARKKVGQLASADKTVRRRRTLALLARRGFGAEISYRVLDEAERDLVS